MVKVISKSSKPRGLLIAIALVVVLAAAGGTVLLIRHHRDQTAATTQKTASTRPLNSVDYGPSKPVDNAANEQRKGNPSVTTTKPTLDSQPGPSAINVTITRVAPDSTAKLVYVRTLIDGATSGDCTLKATKNGQADVTATGQVSLQNNSYSCSNFDLPFSKFPGGGDWNFSVTVASNGNQATGSWPQAVNIPSQ